MPRYFFHIHDGLSLRDDEGTELADLDAARSAAVKLAGAALGEEPKRFWTGEEWRLDVTDGVGLILFSLHFLAVDAPALGGRPAAKN